MERVSAVLDKKVATADPKGSNPHYYQLVLFWNICIRISHLVADDGMDSVIFWIEKKIHLKFFSAYFRFSDNDMFAPI